MTPQPSNQELEQQLREAVCDCPNNETAKYGWHTTACHERQEAVSVLIARAADAREREVLEWALSEPIGAFTRQRLDDRLAELRKQGEGK